MSNLSVFGTIEFGSSKIGITMSPTYIGGNGVTSSLAAANFIPVSLMGVIGTDMDVTILKRALGRKISIENIEQYEGNTFRYTGIYDKGLSDIKEHQIQFGVYAQYIPVIKTSSMRNTKQIFFSGSNPKYSLQVLQQCKLPKIIGVATMMYHLENNYEYAMKLIQQSSYLFTNKKEYVFLEERLSNLFDFAKNLEYVFVTEGEKDVSVITKETQLHFSFNKNTEVLDPTNAGDVFAGTVMGMIAQGVNPKTSLKKIISKAHEEAIKVITNNPYYRKVYQKSNTILDQILENKRKEIVKAKKSISLDELKQNLGQRKTEIRGFAKALQKENIICLIAEIKKASPSKGIIKSKFDHIAIAKIYQKSGSVDAISVLTDEKYFQGRLSFIKDVKKVTSIPILRKDFIIDEYQIYESYLAEADAILLIVAALEQKQLLKLIKTADKLGLACLIEVHSQKELAQALSAKAKIIGINARDLKTFKINKMLFGKLSSNIPDSILKVAESGIENYEDVKNIKDLGLHAILIGSAIMQASNIQKKLAELKGEMHYI